MNTFIILLRGINVGGNNKIPMKILIPLLQNNGFSNVSSYIQTGNIVLDANEDPTFLIQSIITEHFGLSPSIITLPIEEFKRVRSNNPYSQYEGKLVHCYLCENKPTLNHDYTSKYKSEHEEFTLIDNTLYLYAPQGIGRSKFVSNIEKCLGVASTGRNLNTINKLFDLLPT